MPRAMTPDELRGFVLQGTRTAKLATTMADGGPHVMPVWFVLDGEDFLFNTGDTSLKARNLRRDPRVSLLIDDEQPPFAFVHVRGTATLIDDLGEILRWATKIGGRYMGSERAEEFGSRNAVPGELLVRVTPERVITQVDVAGY